MGRLRSSTSTVLTYNSLFNILDSHDIFYVTFGSDPIIASVTVYPSRAMEDSKTLCAKLVNLYNLSQLHIVCDIAQLQDIALKHYDFQQIISQICLCSVCIKT